MKLFHGTIHEFTIPDPSRGRVGTDFGAGFYLTDSERMAEDWLNGEENKHVISQHRCKKLDEPGDGK